MTRPIALLNLVTFLLALDMAGQRTPDRYERVLLPIYTSTPGVNGGRWQTQLLLRNEGHSSLDVFPIERGGCISSAACFRLMRGYPSLAPQSSAMNVGRPFQIGPLRVANSDPAAPGVFFYVEREGGSSLSAQLHVADVQRRAVALGTRIPVVRESDFVADTTDILGVPLARGSRTALRVYDRDSAGGAEIRLRIHEMAGAFSPTGAYFSPRLLADEVLSFTHTGSDSCAPFDLNGCPPGFSYKPGFIEITDLLARFLVLQEVVDRQFGVRIELEPVTPGLAFWPMVSVTENATSEVSIYTAR